jgi:hypothetical protein
MALARVSCLDHDAGYSGLRRRLWICLNADDKNLIKLRRRPTASVLRHHGARRRRVARQPRVLDASRPELGRDQSGNDSAREDRAGYVNRDRSRGGFCLAPAAIALSHSSLTHHLP